MAIIEKQHLPVDKSQNQTWLTFGSSTKQSSVTRFYFCSQFGSMSQQLCRLAASFAIKYVWALQKWSRLSDMFRLWPNEHQNISDGDNLKKDLHEWGMRYDPMTSLFHIKLLNCVKMNWWWLFKNQPQKLSPQISTKMPIFQDASIKIKGHSSKFWSRPLNAGSTFQFLSSCVKMK